MSHGDDQALSTSPNRVVSFLRALAERAERDQQFAATLADCLAESGLLDKRVDGAPGAQRPARSRRAPGAGGGDGRAAPLDPFAYWRTQGEVATQAALDALDLVQLRAIVRAHRLDPARVSARWAARDRVVALIMEQVKARLNHGRAFERV